MEFFFISYIRLRITKLKQRKKKCVFQKYIFLLKKYLSTTASIPKNLIDQILGNNCSSVGQVEV